MANLVATLVATHRADSEFQRVRIPTRSNLMLLRFFLYTAIRAKPTDGKVAFPSSREKFVPPVAISKNRTPGATARRTLVWNPPHLLSPHPSPLPRRGSRSCSPELDRNLSRLPNDDSGCPLSLSNGRFKLPTRTALVLPARTWLTQPRETRIIQSCSRHYHGDRHRFDHPLPDSPCHQAPWTSSPARMDDL